MLHLGEALGLADPFVVSDLAEQVGYGVEGAVLVGEIGAEGCGLPFGVFVDEELELSPGDWTLVVIAGGPIFWDFQR